MNEAEKRRQMKLAKKAASHAKRGKTTIGAPEQQTLTIQQDIDLAMQHHKAGRLSEAESIYQQILQVDPSQPDTLNLLGVIAYQVGKNDIAVNLITKALAIKPNFAKAHNNLAEVLEKVDVRRAIEEYETYLALVEGIPEEEPRMLLVEERLKRLKGNR